MSHSKPNTFAFLVGINDYMAFDETGAHNLHGAIHDVKHYLRLARSVGVPPQNIRIACAPMTSLAVPAGTVCTGATLADIQEGLDWLATKLGTAKVSAGIVSISAHGSYDATHGPVICASDTQDAGDALTGTLPVTGLFAHLSSRAARTPVTIFLDACDAGTGPSDTGDTSRALRGRAPIEAGPVQLTQRPDDLLLAASAPGHESYEIKVDDSVRGAFSWAALALLERWGVHRTADDTHFDISYGELQERINTLLKAMHVRQRSHFDARPAQRVRKVLAELWKTGLGDPDRPLYAGGREISPGNTGSIAQYKVIRTSNQALKATLCVPGDGCKDWTSGKIYWFQNSAANSPWKSFKQALRANDFTIEPDTIVDPEQCAFNPAQPDHLYNTGDTWSVEALGSVDSKAGIGKFTYGTATGWLIADDNKLVRWLLDENPGVTYLVNFQSSLAVSKESSPPSSTQNYYEADD